MNIAEPESKRDSKIPYGQGDATYIAVGGEAGLGELVDHFYSFMDSEPKFAELRAMHSADLSESAARLKAFLSGWMGGPSKYQEKFGSINIPGAHAHLVASAKHGAQWLDCMDAAMSEMHFSSQLKRYLIDQFRFPVERILQRIAMQSG